jgi:predicted nucleotidyltransferase
MLPQPPSGLLPCEVSARALLEGAIAHCSRRHCTPCESVLRRLRSGDPELHSTLRYALAKGLSNHLSQLGCTFRGVYVYGSALAHEAAPCSDIDMIFVVSHSCDEVARLLRNLDLALVTSYRHLLGLGRQPASLLDVRVVDASEESARSGPAALLWGVFTKPVCLWNSTSSTAKRMPQGACPVHPSACVDEELLHL